MSENIAKIGIDYSISSPAVAIIYENEIYIHCYGKKKIQGKYQEKNWHILVDEYPVYKTNEDRYSKLASNVFTFINTVLETRNLKARIEGYSFGSKGQVFNLAENCGLLKHKLWSRGIEFDTATPSVVKKYATGKGNADKIMMYDAFINDVGIDLKEMFNDKSKEGKIMAPITDVVDAYFIAKSIGELEV